MAGLFAFCGAWMDTGIAVSHVCHNKAKREEIKSEVELDLVYDEILSDKDSNISHARRLAAINNVRMKRGLDPIKDKEPASSEKKKQS